MSAAAWALEVDRDWAKQFESLHDAVAYLGLEAINRVDAKSPVDTGRFRGNWVLSIGAPDATILETEDKTGNARTAWNAAKLQSYPEQGFPPIFLQNNLPYAERLENGYSMQAPGGMVSMTIAELSAIWEGIEI